jgi:hypothetical protein
VSEVVAVVDSRRTKRNFLDYETPEHPAVAEIPATKCLNDPPEALGSGLGGLG